jgi:hypothetical protein
LSEGEKIEQGAWLRLSAGPDIIIQQQARMSEATSGAPAGLINDDPAFRFAHAGYLIVNAVQSFVSMKPAREEEFPVSTKNSLFRRKNSLFAAKKFPVPQRTGNSPATP